MASTAAGSWRRFLIPEAYPILFFTVSASIGFVGFLGRLLVSDPDIRCSKVRRGSELPDPEIEAQIGERHYNHFIRRNLAGELGNIGIFPNDAIVRMMSKN